MGPFVGEKSCPYDGSLTHRKGKRKTKESPRDTEEKVPMCFIGEGGNRPSLMSSEEQLAQAVKKCAKIVIAIAENDESISVDRDVLFETPLTKLGFLTKRTYKVQIGFSLTKTELHLTTCRVDIEAGPNLVNEDYMKPQWKSRISVSSHQNYERE